jgi:hypothetical protein
MIKTILYDKVTVYNSYIQNIEIYKQLLIDSENNVGPSYHFKNWEKWYELGKMMNISMPNKNEKMPELASNDPYEKLQRQFMEACSDAFFTTTEDYIKEWGITYPKWARSGLSICKFVTIKDNPHMSLQYHTDTHHFNEDSPGLKFAVTCTMYLNDDYEGGEISFLDESTGKIIKYKPKAGDVLVFPSGEPYYHGTHKVLSGDRYIIRTWWYEDFPGTEEWHENEKKYGKELWKEMEDKRIKEAFESGQYHRHIVYPGKEQEVLSMGHKSKPFYVKED